MAVRGNGAQLALGVILLAACGAVLAQQSPDALLQRIDEAVSDISYRGTMIRSVDGRVDTMRVLHSNRNGILREKLVAQDGEGREIIRRGNERICLYPGRRIKLVDVDAGPSSSLVRLPLGASDLGRYYMLEDHGPARVAGRSVRRYFVRPRDGLRYGQRLWLDDETLLPLRMEMVGHNRVIEEIRFTDVEIGIDIPDGEFESDIDSSDFQVIRASAGPEPRVSTTRVGQDVTAARSTGWPAEASPGFRFRSTMTQTVRINGQVMQRITFSDGLATVSVFIAARRPGADDQAAQVARLGAAHSFRRQVGDKTLTLVGEVPVETLRMFADLAERQLMAGGAAQPAEDN